MASIRFLGHASWELTDGGTTVLVDPWLTGNPKAAAAAGDLSADAVLLTHGHPDHYGDTIDIAKRTGAPVLALTELAGEIAGILGDDHTVHNPNMGGTIDFDWGWVRVVPAWHSGTSPNGTVHPPAGLVVNFGGTTFYFVGDSALFSDLALPGQAVADRRRDHPDRRALHDGPPRRRRGCEAHRSKARDPRTLQHLPARRDRRAGLQDRRRELDRLPGRDPRAGGDAQHVTHAIVLVEAERSAMATLGQDLADIDGVGGVYSVTGEWDFVAVVHVKRHEDLREVVTGGMGALTGVARTQTMVAFEVFSRHDLEAMFSIGE